MLKPVASIYVQSVDGWLTSAHLHTSVVVLVYSNERG